MDDAIGTHIAVISARRPQNVPRMNAILSAPVTWYVGAGEASAYVSAGASAVVEAGGLIEARNMALEDGFARGQMVVEVSDDLRSVARAREGDGKRWQEPLPFSAAVGHVMDAMVNTGARLGGVAPTSNLFYWHPAHETKAFGFIVGDLIVVAPCPLRFDSGLRLKEDYDYTVQHLSRYGVVARHDGIIASFAHRTNSGGAVSYRTAGEEQRAIAFLMNKWPGFFRMNPRRQNEILLRVRGKR